MVTPYQAANAFHSDESLVLETSAIVSFTVTITLNSVDILVWILPFGLE